MRLVLTSHILENQKSVDITTINHHTNKDAAHGAQHQGMTLVCSGNAVNFLGQRDEKLRSTHNGGQLLKASWLKDLDCHWKREREEIWISTSSFPKDVRNCWSGEGRVCFRVRLRLTKVGS